MNRTENIVSHRTSKSTKTYSIEDLSSLFDSLSISYKRVGREINADIDKTGHHSYKINPTKGAYFSTDGQSGTISGLLKRLNADSSNIPSTPSRPTDTTEKSRKIAQIIKDSEPFSECNDAAKAAIEKYFRSRKLPILLPETARVQVVPQGYDLIVPLYQLSSWKTAAEIPAVHITMLTKDGEKRPQAWLDGGNKCTKGTLKNEAGHYVLNTVDADESQLSPSGIRWVGIGEGLETVVAGRFLSGWNTVFGISASGVAAFLDTPSNVDLFKKNEAGLAIFVDRDISGAGQKASASLVRKAKENGIPVLFLVPPSIIKGGKKGADWNDALVELQEDGAKAALQLAISRSEEELSKIEVGKIVPIDNVQDSDESGKTVSAEIARIPVNQAFFETRKQIKDYLDNKQLKPVLLQIDMGVGKSHILSDLSRDHLYVGDPLAIITPTKSLAQEAAQKSGGLFREGRSDDANRAGFCFIYPEIEPFSDKMRSIVAHKCSSCEHGLAAMAVSRNEVPEVDPCSYILHTIESRQAQVLSTTAAMIEGDPNIGTIKQGDSVIKRKVILDDTAEFSDQRYVHGGHIGEWIRAANHAIRFDQTKIDSGDSTDQDGDRQERIDETRKLIPFIEALSMLIASNPGEEQRMINPEDWTEFSELVKSSKLKWVDGLSAEAIYKDREGNLEIPLRTLKALGEAFARGTVWIRKGMLHFSCPTQAFSAIKSGALILDATPSLAVRSVVEALGGNSTEIRAKQDSLKVRLIVSGNHGKTACSIDSPSFGRERTHFMTAVKNLEKEFGTEDLAVLSHLSFVDALKNDLAGIDAGHWGMHDRGHNLWEKKKALLIWGVQQLSPSVAERLYMSDRQIVLEAGGPAWPLWDGARADRWYQIPGQKKKIGATGYKNDFIDFWNREWVTKKLVQAIGRLRAVRRQDEELQIIIHASFPFTESFGLEFSSVEKPDWRTMSDYQTGRKGDQIEKGIIAFHATGEAGRRPVNDFLKSIGMTGIKPEAWAEIKELASGSRHEYIAFPLGTTPDLFGKDIEVLIETLEKLASFAQEEGMKLEDLVSFGIVDPDYVESVALEVLKASMNTDDWRKQITESA